MIVTGGGQSRTIDRYEVLAEVRRRGLTLSKLARRNGMTPTCLHQVFDRPFPKAEKIIAEFMGVEVEAIWPERVERRRQRAAA
jgi:Ner family transcriptional regulator